MGVICLALTRSTLANSPLITFDASSSLTFIRPWPSCFWPLLVGSLDTTVTLNLKILGDDYLANNVPYIGLRVLPAILGSLTPPLLYGIMKESGYPRLAGGAGRLLFGLWCVPPFNIA